MQHLYTLVAILLTASITIGQDTIQRDDIRAALKLSALEFTRSEIDSMIENVEGYREDILSNRKISIDNSTGPAFLFNPLPIGFQVPTGPDELMVEGNPVVRPANIDDLAFMTISELAYLIRTNQVSSLELTRFFIDRLKEHDKSLHCVISYTETQALERARAIDEEIARGEYRGLLHGIPYGLKDLFATRGTKTTWGATPFKEQYIDTDAAVVTMLDQAGAVLIAKLTLGALAWGDVWFGERTRNPWDTTRGSSGSSAGSASAVAAGLVPFAIGTETLGSIVSPSTICGTTGLRPTFGRVSRYGAMALSWTMDKVGPICRSAEDCAIVFAALEGADPRDPTTVDASFRYRSDLEIGDLRVGYIPSFFQDAYPFRNQDSAALEVLRAMGVELVPLEVPEYPDITFILNVEAAAAFDELTRSNMDNMLVRQIRNAWPNAFRSARTIPAVEYVQAMRLRALLIEEMARLFEKVDVIVHPSWNGSMLRVTNMTGHPTVVVPNGFSEGRPTSISFTGKLFSEDWLLSLARDYQDATSWDEMHPAGY